MWKNKCCIKMHLFQCIRDSSMFFLHWHAPQLLALNINNYRIKDFKYLDETWEKRTILWHQKPRIWGKFIWINAFLTVCYFFFFLVVPLYFYLFFFICGGFCHTLKWNSHGFTCVPHPNPPSHLPLHPFPLGFPSAPGPSACLMHPT